MSARERHSPARGPHDPAESWEIPCPDDAAGAFFRGISDWYPRTPRWEEDVPSAVLKSLQDLCGVERLGQIFIIPQAARSIGWKEKKVISPESVLAVGSRAVALWTETPEPGVKVSIALENLAAVEDVTILLYGRLSFLSSSERLTIRYNILARRGFEPALLELRRRLAGPAQAVPRSAAEASSLPFKWRRLLEMPIVRLSENAPVAFRFAKEPGRFSRDIERGELIALNPHELVFMCDPPEAIHTYGEDSCIVPRSRISSATSGGGKLLIRSNGAELPLLMEPGLCETAARWFA